MVPASSTKIFISNQSLLKLYVICLVKFSAHDTDVLHRLNNIMHVMPFYPFYKWVDKECYPTYNQT